MARNDELEHFPHGRKIDNRLRLKKYIKHRPIFELIKVHYDKYRDACLSEDINDEMYMVKISGHTNEYFEAWTDPRFAKIKKTTQNKIYPAIKEEYWNYLGRALVPPGFEYGTGRVIRDVITNPDWLTDDSEPEQLADIVNADFYIGKRSRSFPNLIIPCVILEQKSYGDSCRRTRCETESREFQKFNAKCMYALVLNHIDMSTSELTLKKKWNFTSYFIKNHPDDLVIRLDSTLKLFMAIKDHLVTLPNVLTKEKVIETGVI